MKKNKGAKLKIGLVITSIFDSGWLERFVETCREDPLFVDLKIYFIPDNKTPADIYDLAIKIGHESGLHIWIPNMYEQNQYISQFCDPAFILENSDHRRNIGYIKAYEENVDIVISMDDDNFPINPNFITAHVNSLSRIDGRQVSASRGFFNNCSLLESNTIFHPRGFPLTRKSSNDLSINEVYDVTVGVNAGMWTIAPDVDAISWLVCEKNFPEVESVEGLFLAPDTYCPVNSQNTALIGHLIPAYYFVRMGYDIGGGLRFDRLGDIYSGYFLQKVAKEMGFVINFGNPVVTHERNSHNYLNDANSEWGCLRTVDDFCDWLEGVKLSADGSVLENYFQLSQELDEFASLSKFAYMPTATKGFYHQMAYDMRVWCKIISQLTRVDCRVI